MQFMVLGPLEVSTTKSVTAPMLRVLLATLLTRPNRAVPVDVLIDTCWHGEPVPKARQKLQVHVHRLRQALGDPGRIRRDHSTYTLMVLPGELDAERFETLLDAGADAARRQDWEASATLIRQALDLWRGEPYDEFDRVPLLRAEADRLTERRLTGFEDLYAAELACGRHHTVVPGLRDLAERHPLRERLHELLMLALYRGGRQAEALEVYRRARSRLVRELGVEPGPQLVSLHTAVLTTDPSLDLPRSPTTAATTGPVINRPAAGPTTGPAAGPAAGRAGTGGPAGAGPATGTGISGPAVGPTAAGPAQLPAAVPDFTGRDKQLDLIRDLVRDHPGTTPVVSIAGAAGIGKTALAVRAAHELKHDYPDGQLYVDLRGADAAPLAPTGVLARFLRALGVTGPAIPADPDERAALYRSRLAGARMLVLLDNAVGEEQVRPLLPGAAGCLVLVTSRARVAGLEGSYLVDLELFDTEHAIDLLARVAGRSRVAAEPVAAEDIVRLCGRLPLAVRIAAARLVARPHWRLGQLAARLADEHHRLDELRLGDLEVRASLALSDRDLDPVARQAFHRLGLLDAPRFPAWVAAAVLDRPPPDGELIVDLLTDTQLLEPAGTDGYRFHDLVRLYARELALEEPLPDRTAAISRAIHGWLTLAIQATTPPAATSSTPPDESAGWLETGRAGDESAGAPAGRGVWVPEGVVVGDAAAWLETERAALVCAVDQAVAIGQEPVAWKLASTLTSFLDIRGYFDDWRRTHETGLAAARRLGDHRFAGAMLMDLSRLELINDRYEQTWTLLEQAEQAFRTAGDRHGLADVTYHAGATLRSLGRPDDARSRLGQALALFRELGDIRGEAQVRQEIAAAYLDQRRPEDARGHLEFALDTFRTVGDRRNEALALRWLGGIDRGRQELDRAESRLLRSREIFEELGDLHNAAYVVGDLGKVRLEQGRWTDAEALVERSLESLHAFGDRHGEARALHDLGLIQQSTGNYERAVLRFREALFLWRELGVSLWQERTRRALEESLKATVK